MRKTWVWLLLAGAAGGCSGRGEATEEDSAPPAVPACEKRVALAARALQKTETPGLLRGLADSPGGPLTLEVELRSPPEGALLAGTASLADEPDPASCQHCVRVVGLADEGAPVFAALAGTMQLEAVSDPPATSRGHLGAIVLRPVTLDEDTGRWSEVPGGTCYTLDAVDWDWQPKAGDPCETCAGAPDFACDPAQQVCVPSCTESGSGACSGGKVCSAQPDAGSACYLACTPFGGGSPCGGGYTCLAQDSGQQGGLCVPSGGGQQGRACASSPVYTDCEPGLRCVAGPTGSTCVRECDFFGASLSCPAELRCALGGLCLGAGDPAALGEACGGTSGPGAACAAEAGRFAGVCIQNEAGALRCASPCRPGASPTGCASGKACVISEGYGQTPYCQGTEAP